MIHRRNYLLLKQIKTKPELAALLKICPSFLTNTLYIKKSTTNYHDFEIPKKSGGVRTISAPPEDLKEIQRKLADLLQDCKQVIHFDKSIKCSLSHGFEREKSIITNASIHKRKKTVLNLDLEDFFGKFNFGRVRGFFISNKDFRLDPHIATVVAQIACYNDKLPQGSPCSPVIANLITNSLDIKLSKMARKYGCSYTRYADDITFSTRKIEFPKSIIKNNVPLELGGKLLGEIRRSGFSVNPNKTRLQFKDSRQEATGLVINKKVNIKSEYWRDTRAMAHRLFKKGKFDVYDSDGNVRDGKISELEGRLAFIDSIDYFNNVNSKNKVDKQKNGGLNSHLEKLNSRERIYARFLHYKNFFANEHPTILTEGKTDNVYLKAALCNLQNIYPNLVSKKTDTSQYIPLLRFPNLNSKTMYFMDLGDGATPFLRFVQRYTVDFNYYENQKPKSPVIMILDNDDGPKTLLNHLVKNIKSCPNTLPELKSKGFVHLFKNLYIILTPLNNDGSDSMMEDLFDKKTLGTVLDGKTFSTEKSFDEKKHYGKHIFSSKVVRSNKANVNFDKFTYIFNEIEKVRAHFSTLKF
ncbi:retron Ec67 family RNA-directed DNA polymerase/endonuclease [Shewanella algae]|uniref:retron Ec67 family RNA-directed DNA polymerase/endonuclease n=1 Tax=Shewanella algae TaxID=38313 RepID=UPI0031F4CAB4